MVFYSASAVERAMKVQEVILRAMAKKLTWWQAAEIIGISDRQMRRWYQRYREFGYDGLFDRRRGRPSPKRVPVETVERVLELYREKYFDLNVRHFREKLVEEHRIPLSYSWVKKALQGAGLVKKGRQRGAHRRRRPRRPMAGMLLHQDGSRHRWFQDDRWYDLLVVLDDATGEVYYAQLVEEESTRTVMAALRAVIERKGIFCALYSDRASHFFRTPRAGGKIDPHQLTQVGRALKELGIQMIPAYSPQARGRSERNFGTWQGRLPQELRLRGIATLEEANRFLCQEYIGEFNRRFPVAPTLPGNAFVPCRRRDLDRVFSMQQTRTVAQDNTIGLGARWLQIEATGWRGTLAGCRVTVHEHLDGTWMGPSRSLTGRTLSVVTTPEACRCCPTPADAGGGERLWKSRSEENSEKRSFPPRLEIPPQPRDSHFPTAAATGLQQLEPDRSRATKTGHFNLLTTQINQRALTLDSAVAPPAGHGFRVLRAGR